MNSDNDPGRLRAAIGRLAKLGVAPGIATALDADKVARGIGELAVADVPAWSGSGNPDVLPDLERYLASVATEALRLLGGGWPPDLDAVCGHAERSAARKFPLEALLQTHRAVHRVLSRDTRDAALAVADDEAHVTRVVAAVTDFSVEFSDALSAIATRCYIDQTRRLAEAEGDRRSELMNTLLDGYDESDRRTARLLRRAGYLEQRQSYCVAVARSVNPLEMESAARAERMSDAVMKELRALPSRTIAGLRDGLVIVVISATRRLSGWTAPQSLLAERVYPLLRRVGPAALIGLSNDAPSTAHIPRALAEAKIALDHADVANRVMQFGEISFRQILVAQAREERRLVLPVWSDDFFELDRRSRGVLSDTLRAYANCDMNVQRTAKVLSVHPNTIYARMQRIEDATGRRPVEYHALTELLLAIDCRSQDTP